MQDQQTLHILNVGYGDAFYFSGPEGNLLLDTGSGLPDEFISTSGRTPAADWFAHHGIRSIDHLILTHVHEDHVGGLPRLLDQVKFGEVLTSLPPELFTDRMFKALSSTDLPSTDLPYTDLPSDLGQDKPRAGANALGSGRQTKIPSGARLFLDAIRIYSSCLHALMDQGIPVRQLRQGDRVRCAGLDILVLGPDRQTMEEYIADCSGLERSIQDKGPNLDNAQIEKLAKLDAVTNAVSLLLKICRGPFKGLFCADDVPASWPRTEELLQQLSDVNVIKLPHHGQRDSIDEELTRLMPLSFCITTSSSTLKYNSAAPGVYSLLAEQARAAGRDLQFLFSDPPPADHPWGRALGSYGSLMMWIGEEISWSVEKG